MTKAELKSFRAKLVKARAHSALQSYEWLESCLRPAGFSWPESQLLAEQVRDWYFHGRTRAERKAMWDNSIAALDAQIAAR